MPKHAVSSKSITTMATPRPVLHNILDSSQWPLPVKTIAQALERSLPSYVATGPYPFVSARATSLLNELSSSPLLRVTREDILTLKEKPLADVFDIILSTVIDLRELAKCEPYRGPRSTIPLWSSLMKALGYACSNAISIV